jgi:hypothetical protein
MDNARKDGAGAGSYPAGLAISGDSATGSISNVESWDGSTWTEVGDVNTNRDAFAGGGTSTSALATGGNNPPTTNNESWNGSSWTEVGDINTGRRGLRHAGADNTSAIVFGGFPPNVVEGLNQVH